MEEILRHYSNQEIRYRSMSLYFVSVAKDIIFDCKNARIPVWGLEALTLSGRGIQPHEAHTLWFQKESAENWDTALAFLSREENQDFLYELYIGDVD